MNTEKLKKLSMQIMIGGLVGAAAIAVAAVLAGSFNDTFEKALYTLLLVMLHALISLAFVERTSQNRHLDFRFFENSVLFIVILSFFTSIFGVWGLLDGGLVGKIYSTYAILLFACLHGQMLLETRGKQANIDAIVGLNYIFMAIVVVMILPLIWISRDNISSFYYRPLAASGIIDATLTILAVLLHRIYVQKHPAAPSAIFTSLDAYGNPVPAPVPVQKRHIHPFLWLLGIYLIGQIILSLIFAITR